MVGRANGRSISAFTTALPRNSSRTSTHAISVPITTLIRVTTTDTPTVSSSAARACGEVTSLQNWLSPPSSDFCTTAASGSSTITLSQTTAIPPTNGGRDRLRVEERAGRAPGSASALLGSGNPQALLDLGDDAARRIEELRHHLVPAPHVVDREEAGGRWELALVDERGHHRPVAPLGEDLLRRIRVQPVDELLRGRLEEVRPVVDALGVALADHERDHRVGDEAVPLVLVPVRVHEPGLHDLVHVGRERELDDVRGEARHNGPCLVAGGAEGLAEGHALAGRRLLESRDELAVGLLRRRVGHEGDLAATAAVGRSATPGHAHDGGQRRDGGQEADDGSLPHSLLNSLSRSSL